MSDSDRVPELVFSDDDDDDGGIPAYNNYPFGGEECLNQDLLRWLSLSQNGADAKSCDYGTSDGERVHPLDHCGNAYVPTMYGRLYATDIGQNPPPMFELHRARVPIDMQDMTYQASDAGADMSLFNELALYIINLLDEAPAEEEKVAALHHVFELCQPTDK